MAKSPLTMIMIMVMMLTTSAQVNLGLEGPDSDPDQAMVKNLARMINQLIDVSSLKGYKYCPPPYSHVLGECFYVHKFIPLLTWQQADTFCKQAGGILAEPRNFGAVIADLFNKDMAGKIFDSIFTCAWLGGRKVNNNNKSSSFQWSSGRPITENVGESHYSYYPTSEPEDCLMMGMNRDDPCGLAVAACDRRCHYVCQLPMA